MNKPATLCPHLGQVLQAACAVREQHGHRVRVLCDHGQRRQQPDVGRQLALCAQEGRFEQQHRSAEPLAPVSPRHATRLSDVCRVQVVAQAVAEEHYRVVCVWAPQQGRSDTRSVSPELYCHQLRGHTRPRGAQAPRLLPPYVSTEVARTRVGPAPGCVAQRRPLGWLPCEQQRRRPRRVLNLLWMPGKPRHRAYLHQASSRSARACATEALGRESCVPVTRHALVCVHS